MQTTQLMLALAATVGLVIAQHGLANNNTQSDASQSVLAQQQTYAMLQPKRTKYRSFRLGGVNMYGDSEIDSGNILVRQRGTEYRPGDNLGLV